MIITTTKPPIPLLWLDTWFILDLAAALLSKDEKRKKEADYIVEKIIDLTGKKKILCPKGDQDVEIGVSNNARIVEKAREIQTRMSLGISLNLYVLVENLQEQRMMKAVIKNQNEVEFPWKSIFANDPIRIIDQNNRFIVDVDIPLTQAQIDEQIRVNKSIANDWENIRLKAQASKRKYDEVLKAEFNGKADAVAHTMASITTKTMLSVPMNQNEYLDALDIAGTPLAFWGHYSGKKGDINSLLKFYRSTEYSQIPYVNVGTRLLAELVSGNEKVSPSDVMDIHHLSTVLPFATYMVVDKRMRNRIQGKTNLEKEYPGVIIKWQDVSELLDKLDN